MVHEQLAIHHAPIVPIANLKQLGKRMQWHGNKVQQLT